MPTQETNSGLWHGFTLGEDGWDDEMEANLLALGRVLGQLSVLDRDLTAPPGSPTTGDRYIVGPSATGDWATHDDDIAVWDGSAWVFYTPKSGWLGYIVDEGKISTYTTGGGWSAGPSAGIDDNADATAITIDSSERVGIGEASPSAKLHISETGIVSQYVESTDNNSVQIRLITNSEIRRIVARDSGDTTTKSQISFEDGVLIIAGGTTIAPALYADVTNQRVGIGSNTAPTGTLAVTAANARFSVSEDTSIADEASVSLESVLDGATEGVLRIYTSAQEYGEFQLRGSSNAVVEIQDPQTVFVTTDTDTNYCVLSDGDGTYSLKNRIGASRSFALIFEGRG